MKTIRSSYDAIEIVENFNNEDQSYKDILRAWAFLIRAGVVWHMQGWYGRTAADMIQRGYISRTGRVQWSYINHMVDMAYEQVMA